MGNNIRQNRLQGFLQGILTFIVGLTRRLDLGSCLAIGETFGFFAYLLMKRKNRIGMRNLDLVFGDRISTKEKNLILRKMWINFGRNMVDFLRIPTFKSSNIDRFVKFSGFEHLQNAKNAGNGSLVLTAHFGNWDLLALASGIKGIRVAMITKRLKNAFWNEFWMRHRIGSGNWGYPIWKKKAAKGILKALAENVAVAFVLDQDIKLGENPIFVEFFGKKASTTPSLAALSKKKGLPIIPAFMIRTSRTTHRAEILEPIQFENIGDLKDSIEYNTKTYLKLMEKYILKYPEQWIWIHRRWKRSIDGVTDFYADV